MADDLDLDGEKDINRSEKRFKDLSSKVEMTAKERDAEAEARKKAEADRDTAVKEKEFYSSFSDVVSQHPNAKDHKDDIKAKVLAGYTVEDATVAVLAKAGKLTMAAKEEEKDSIAGGSATTNTTSKGSKSINEMNQSEKRAAFVNAVERGDISTT